MDVGGDEDGDVRGRVVHYDRVERGHRPQHPIRQPPHPLRRSGSRARLAAIGAAATATLAFGRLAASLVLGRALTLVEHGAEPYGDDGLVGRGQVRARSTQLLARKDVSRRLGHARRRRLLAEVLATRDEEEGAVGRPGGTAVEGGDLLEEEVDFARAADATRSARSGRRVSGGGEGGRRGGGGGGDRGFGGDGGGADTVSVGVGRQRCLCSRRRRRHCPRRPTPRIGRRRGTAGRRLAHQREGLRPLLDDRVAHHVAQRIVACRGRAPERGLLARLLRRRGARLRRVHPRGPIERHGDDKLVGRIPCHALHVVLVVADDLGRFGLGDIPDDGSAIDAAREERIRPRRPAQVVDVLAVPSQRAHRAPVCRAVGGSGLAKAGGAVRALPPEHDQRVIARRRERHSEGAEADHVDHLGVTGECLHERRARVDLAEAPEADLVVVAGRGDEPGGGGGVHGLDRLFRVPRDLRQQDVDVGGHNIRGPR